MKTSPLLLTALLATTPLTALAADGKSSGGTRVVEKQVIVVHEHDRDFVPPGHRKHKHNKGHHHGHKKH